MDNLASLKTECRAFSASHTALKLLERMQAPHLMRTPAVPTLEPNSDNIADHMLESSSFVAPYAHFRVFQSDRGGDSARHRSASRSLLLSLTSDCDGVDSSLPTDLHLREFAQLEAHVKAATQQQQHPSSASAPSVNAQALADASAGSLVECFMFYPRLMTAESFTWPDFLATVFTKLAEHFVNHANEAVRSAIVAVFQQSAAHVAQVNDPSKLIAHLLAVLTTATTPSARMLALRVLETMPTLLQRDAAVHAQLVARLDAADAQERAAATAATRAVLALAPATLQTAVFERILTSGDTTHTSVLALLELAARSPQDAESAWNHCGVLYHDLADNEAAVNCLCAMTALATRYPTQLLSSHVPLLQHAIQNDPRTVVQSAALVSVRELLANDATTAARASAWPSLVASLADEVCNEHAYARTRLAALRALEHWCRMQALDASLCSRVVETAVQLGRRTPKVFGAAAAQLLATVAQRALGDGEGDDREGAATVFATTAHVRSMVATLLELLHPSAFDRAPIAWTSTLECVERLALTYPHALGEHVASCLVELLALERSAAATDDHDRLKRQVVAALSHIAGASSDALVPHIPTLQRELAVLRDTDARARAALAVALMRAVAPSDAAAAELEQTLTTAPYATQADRYDMAKAAMTHGHFQLGLALSSTVARASDKETFGSWLHALRALSSAEASMLRDRRVSLHSIYQLSRAETLLHAAATSRFSFAFQLHVVARRVEWMKLVLQAQQFAGEAAYSNTSGGAREEALRDRLKHLARRYRLLRSSLLGASPAALDSLEGLAQLSELLALAIDGFLLLRVELSSVPTTSLAARRLSGSSASTTAAALWDTCRALDADIHGKVRLLQRIDASRRAALGAKVMQQLLETVCSLPLALPRQFFRERLESSQRRLAASVQFLTFAESSAFTSKPRARSQLGVAFGTDFNSLLKGVLEVSSSGEARAFWRDMVVALEIDVRVRLMDKSAAATHGDASASNDVDRIHKRIAVDWSTAATRAAARGTDDGHASLYLAFETPVHVLATSLRVKGSFQLLARVSAVDNHCGKWLLAPSGCTRGFIVY